MADRIETITLGGGCFWCTEVVYERVRGVTAVESGYSNGHVDRPSYETEAYHQHYFADNPNQGYCAMVVAPRVEKFKKTFAAKIMA